MPICCRLQPWWRDYSAYDAPQRLNQKVITCAIAVAVWSLDGGTAGAVAKLAQDDHLKIKVPISKSPPFVTLAKDIKNPK